MTAEVKVGDTLYGVHESLFYAGKVSPRKQYKVTPETVTEVYTGGYGDYFRTEYYMDGFKRIGHYRPHDFGKYVFTDKEEAGRKRHELSVLRKADKA